MTDRPTRDKRPAAAVAQKRSKACADPVTKGRRHAKPQAAERASPAATAPSPKKVLMLKNTPENQKCREALVQDASAAKAPQLMLQNLAEDQRRTAETRGKCYRAVDVKDGVAVPTEDWRIVPKGVACPRGCEYRMDMSQGINLVRLLPGVKTSSSPSSRQSASRSLADKLQEQRMAHQQLQLRSQPQPLAPRQPKQTSGAAQEASCSRQPKPEDRQAKPPTLPIKQGLSNHSSGDAVPPKRLRGDIIPPQRLKNSLAVTSRAKSKSVQKEHTERRVTNCKDGSQEQSWRQLKSRESRREDGKGAERRSARREERVRKLPDGRTVVTETVTLKKVTVLDAGSSR